jgi:hypothetical protein
MQRGFIAAFQAIAVAREGKAKPRNSVVQPEFLFLTVTSACSRR